MRVTSAVTRKIEDVRALTRELPRIRSDIQGWDEHQRTLGITAEHSISVSVLPPFIAWLQAGAPLTAITLRSENRDARAVAHKSVSLMIQVSGAWLGSSTQALERQ
jgi:DNA-binding transcriptional LysR family regulator